MVLFAGGPNHVTKVDTIISSWGREGCVQVEGIMGGGVSMGLKAQLIGLQIFFN